MDLLRTDQFERKTQGRAEAGELFMALTPSRRANENTRERLVQFVGTRGTRQAGTSDKPCRAESSATSELISLMAPRREPST